jgi:hypothetical protein
MVIGISQTLGWPKIISDKGNTRAKQQGHSNQKQSREFDIVNPVQLPSIGVSISKMVTLDRGVRRFQSEPRLNFWSIRLAGYCARHCLGGLIFSTSGYRLVIRTFWTFEGFECFLDVGFTFSFHGDLCSIIQEHNLSALVCTDDQSPIMSSDDHRCSRLSSASWLGIQSETRHF